jgi:protein-S-isoprenylcysteine O-methyltransferase Ste14
MDIKERFKRWFKLRFAIVYPFGILAIFFYKPDDNSFRLGIPFIIAGLLIRVWANGYAVKMNKLTTSGPYAFMRHPLYLGTIFIVAGFVIILKALYFGVLFIATMAAVYYITGKKEEKSLENKFKAPYLDYKKAVPAILPRVVPYRDGEKWPFSFKRLMQSKEYKLFFWVVIFVVIFYLKEEFIGEQESMNLKMWGFVIVAFLLGLTDLIWELIRRNKKQALV